MSGKQDSFFKNKLNKFWLIVDGRLNDMMWINP